MQLHGPLDFAKDVASVVANEAYKGTPYETKLRNFAQKFGVDLKWTNGGQITPDVVPPSVVPPD